VAHHPIDDVRRRVALRLHAGLEPAVQVLVGFTGAGLPDLSASWGALVGRVGLGGGACSRRLAAVHTLGAVRMASRSGAVDARSTCVRNQGVGHVGSSSPSMVRANRFARLPDYDNVTVV
jgi:hypothetical protein